MKFEDMIQRPRERKTMEIYLDQNRHDMTVEIADQPIRLVDMPEKQRAAWEKSMVDAWIEWAYIPHALDVNRSEDMVPRPEIRWDQIRAEEKKFNAVKKRKGWN